jgi:hypothetical protein
MAGVLESFPEIGDELELPVAVRMLSLSDAFAIDAQRVLAVLHQLACGIRAKGHSAGSHFPTDGSRVLAAPLPVTHGVARRVFFHQLFEQGDHFGFFLVLAGPLPLPGCAPP